MALSDHSFESKHWAKFNQFQVDHEIAPEILEKQIIKLSNTSRAIEAKDLQYKVLRNTCITNNKLHRMKILDTPKCTLCNHETQDSTHRFYYCPQAQKTWQLLTNITSLTPHPHYFSFTTAILNVMHLPRNHPLIILTNITRHFIDKAHSNSITTNNKQQTTNNKQQTTKNKQQKTKNKQQTTSNKQQTTTNNKRQTTNNKQQTTTNNQQPTTNNQQPTNNKQQTTNNKQQTTNNKRRRRLNFSFVPSNAGPNLALCKKGKKIEKKS